jgi:hypothetical protein
MNGQTPRRRGGMALPMVLGSIVIVGTLIAGVMYLATQDFRVGANTLNESRAESAAELGLNRLTTDWDQTKNTTMIAGDTLTKSYTDVGGASVNVFITRLAGPFFWAVSEAQTRGNSVQYGTRRRYAQLFRLNTPTVSFLGAVTAAGNVRASGNVTVSGNDAVPSGWTGCPSLTNVPGAVLSPTATVTFNGTANVSGNPPYTTMAAASDTNTYFNYGGSTYSSLAALANITLPGGTYTGMAPVAAGGVCQKIPPTNWGDPVRHSPAAACETYYPIIHFTGNTSLTTGSGQGIMLVDGDLTESGSFSFTGVVIVRGTIRASGNGNTVTGVVMAAAVDLGDAVTLTGSSTIQYSSCAVQQALSSSATLASAKGRAWVNLY